MDKRLEYITNWNKKNQVKKSISFNRKNPNDAELLEYIEGVTQDMSFNGYVKSLIAADGGFVWE